MDRVSHISVVIPTHDTRELTLACVGSIDEAADPEVDVVVVDDRSQDGTAEALKERFDVEMIRLEEPGGFAVAANTGLARARGDILLLLNSDTEVDSSAFEAVRRAMDQDPGLGVAAARLTYPDGRPQWSGGPEPTLWWLFALASGISGLLGRIPGYRRWKPVSGSSGGEVDWVTGAAMAIRREVWEVVGPLDESFGFYCQDLDFCLRARDAGWGVAIVPDFGVVHHHGATIDRDPGTVGQQHPEILWLDLARWARNRWSTSKSLRAIRALRWGARLRLVGRRIRGIFLLRHERQRWKDETLGYRRALESLLQAAELSNRIPGVS